ncbi:hypothetical protein [Candidatus Nanosyncoccus nanoralicus]|uniref:Uncharacterized protein n=1 Tax=Candidatus Nanosyncoccus nanoralicus TaxID=2171996 RepID=A0ABY0FJJ8_9BACT|nr:hypothetical protein [Candidatus Nanosyncoccus nanoralicus]RYC73260.1 hypothetical protein G3KMM_00482 [Candidatus Nanosyncoccus nanoralicus]
MDSENNLSQDNTINNSESSLDTNQIDTGSSENMTVANESNTWVDASPENTTEMSDVTEEPVVKQEDTFKSTDKSADEPEQEVASPMQPMQTVETPVTQQVAAEKKKMSLTPLFALTTVAAVGALAYTIITSQNQRQQLYHDLSVSKEETKKAQENVIKLEEAVKSDQSIAKENKTTEDKTVVTNNKSVAYDVKYQQLLDVMGKDNLIRGGQIFTNKAGTYAFASLQVGGFNKQKDSLGNEVLVVAGGGWAAEYYRELPNGEWKYAFGGHMAMKCSDYSAEIRRIYHDVERPDGQNNYSCRTDNTGSNYEHL